MHEDHHVPHGHVAVHEHGVLPAEFGEHRSRLVTQFSNDQLGDGALRPRLGTLQGPVGTTQVQQAHGGKVGGVHPESGETTTKAVRVGGKRPHESLGRDQQGTLTTPNGDALVAQGGARHRPPPINRAHDVVVGNKHVAEEHLIELTHATGHAQGADLHSRRVHVNDHGGDSLVLGDVGVGTNSDESPAGDMRP